jgi:hypothetical protein
MKLQLTFLKHIKALSILLIILIVSSSILLYLGLNIRSIIYILIPFTIVLILPTIYIHLNYYTIGRRHIYELKEDGIIVTENEKSVIYSRENFKTLDFYMSGTRFAGLALRNFPFEDYYYAKIIMNNEQEIIISCLFSKKIDKILTSLYKEVPVNKIKDFYPTIQDK